MTFASVEWQGGLENAKKKDRKKYERIRVTSKFSQDSKTPAVTCLAKRETEVVIKAWTSSVSFEKSFLISFLFLFFCYEVQRKAFCDEKVNAQCYAILYVSTHTKR